MNLDPYQAIAVEAPNTARQVVVMSGPGSGKTRVAVERVKRLIMAGHRVAILTYTNAAALEFLSRLELDRVQGIRAAKAVAGYPVEFCGTLHSYCYRLVRRFWKEAGYGSANIAIMPENERDRLLNQIRIKLGYKSQCPMEKLHAQPYDHYCKQVWSDYYFTLRNNALIDYDEILSRGMFLLTQGRVRVFVEIDDLVIEEAQDSAEVDWGIYKSIPALHRFFIGDVDQAIFEWRKAYPQGFLDLIAEKDTVTYRLEYNYRCAETICDAANHLIKHNKTRYEKATLSVTGEMGEVDVISHENEWEERDWLVAAIGKWVPTKSVAVLCRTNYDIGEIRRHLRGVGLSVYAMHENGDRPDDWRRALLLVGLAASPWNEYLAEQFLLLDNDEITVRTWKSDCQIKGTYLSHLVRGTEADEVTHFPTSKAYVLRQLVRNGVSDTTINLIEQTFIDLPEDATCADLMEELYHKHNEHRSHTAQPGQIYTGTIHSAKGREFDCVFLCAFEEMDWMTDNMVEEERRLVFVAVTRARDALHISWARNRKTKWGMLNSRQPSRFLAEMELPHDVAP